MNESTQPNVSLREVREEDLEVFFEQQLDRDANYMAAFTSKNPKDREAFQEHWYKILNNGSITIRTIVYRGEVAGHILSHAWFGDPEVSYWLGREFWGKGIASFALKAFLELTQQRPLFARVAKDNVASLRVLEKCGFRVSGEDRGFSNARGQEVEEYILKLDG
jgi:RimJ/RimL family protein N-acetyltransferase